MPRHAAPRLVSHPPAALPDGDGPALRVLVQTFIRSIGLLAGDTTPCGKPLAVSHAHALMVLLERARLGATPAQRELGAALGIDKSNVARLCQKMEKAGHLRQARSRHDGRARLLLLTPRGRKVAEEVERSSRRRFEELAAAVPGARRPAVLSALAALNDAIAATARQPMAAAPRLGGPPRPARRAGGSST